MPRKNTSTDIEYKAYIPKKKKSQKEENSKEIKYINEETEPKKYKNQKQILQKLLQVEKTPRKVVLPWYIKYFFILIWCFIVLFVVKYIFAIYGMSSKTVKKWWNSNNGKYYKDIFSIDLFLLYTNFSLGYKVKSLFTSETIKFENRAQAEFMTQLIYGYGKLDDTDQIRTLVPKNLFESIIPENYILDHTDDDGIDTLGGVDDNTEYDKETGWPTGSKAMSAWLKILQNWGAKADSQGTWNKNKFNFLSNVYTFNVDAPVIRCFLLQDDKTCIDDKVNNQGLGILLGIQGAGMSLVQCGNNCGWWGFLRNGFKGTDITLSDIASALYNDKVIPNPAGPCPSWGEAATSATTSGATTAVTVSAFTFSTSLAIGPLAGLGIFAVDLLSTKYGQGKCK